MSTVTTALPMTNSGDRNGNGSIGDPLPAVRHAVQELLISSSGFRELDPANQWEMAEAMVKVCHRAALLLKEEMESEEEARMITEIDAQASAATEPGGDSAAAAPARAQRMPTGRGPLASAQAGPQFGEAARTIARTTRDILNAVSFPRFVSY